MRRIAIFFAVAAWAAPALAQVAVVKQDNGRYKDYEQKSSTKDGRVLYWNVAAPGGNRDDLNVSGDSNGDLEPKSVVVPAGKQQQDPTPMVIWSRNSGGDRDIYSSRWQTGRGWTAFQEISQGNDVEDTGVDVFLDPRNDVHAVWWSNTRVPGVWYTKFVNGQWTVPERISPADRDGRNPRFVFSASGLYINYQDWSVSPADHQCPLKERFDP